MRERGRMQEQATNRNVQYVTEKLAIEMNKSESFIKKEFKAIDMKFQNKLK